MKRQISNCECSKIIGGRSIDWGDALTGFCIGFSVAVALVPGGGAGSQGLRTLAAVGGIGCDVKDYIRVQKIKVRYKLLYKYDQIHQLNVRSVIGQI